MVEPRSAVLLPAPQVLYANSQRAFLNDDLVWKMQQMRFKEPRPVEQLLWCIVDVQRAAGQRTVMCVCGRGRKNEREKALGIEKTTNSRTRAGYG